MANVKIEFSWSEVNTKASVVYVVHNNATVASGGPSGRPTLVVEYETPDAPVHLIAFALEFVGDRLTNLKATASIDAGPAVTLATNDEARHLWKGWRVI